MNLEAERLNMGLSPEEIAEKMGVHSRTLRRAEQGHRPHPRHMKKIADFYGVKVTDIWPVDDPVAA